MRFTGSLIFTVPQIGKFLPWICEPSAGLCLAEAVHMPGCGNSMPGWPSPARPHLPG